MKKWSMILALLIAGVLSNYRLAAQVNELAQLALNIEKLNQFRKILSDMKKGYEILTGGYNTVKNIAEGNFKLHQVFLNGLKEVSPAVKKYHRVADIINCQIRIAKQYKAAFNKFSSSGRFSAGELDYLSKVYGKLSSSTLENLDDLLVVLTSGNLSMTDEERLKAIDDIYADVSDKLDFLKIFNQQTEILRIQRNKEAGDIKVLQSLYK